MINTKFDCKCAKYTNYAENAKYAEKEKYAKYAKYGEYAKHVHPQTAKI